MNAGLKAGLNKTERKVATLLIENPDMTAEEPAARIRAAKRTIERNLASMQKNGALIRAG
jgi:predicted HTH transcriptional regulator